MARGKVIPDWLSVFGGPGIIVADKDSRFTGWIFQEFRTARNIAPQTVIPRHHQSLGASERRRGHFRMIIDHMVGNKKPNSLAHKGIFGDGDDAFKSTGSAI